MLSASQALNLLSIFVPKKYKGLKRLKNRRYCYIRGAEMANVWIPDLARYTYVACGANKTKPK